MFESSPGFAVLFLLGLAATSYFFGACVSITRQYWRQKFFKSLLYLILDIFILGAVGFMTVAVVGVLEELRYHLWFAIAISVATWLIGTIFGFRQTEKVP